MNKVWLNDFWDWKGTLYRVPPYKKGEDIRQHHYCNTLLCLHNTTRWKRSGLLSKVVVLIPDNAIPHKAALVKGLLANFG